MHVLKSLSATKLAFQPFDLSRHNISSFGSVPPRLKYAEEPETLAVLWVQMSGGTLETHKSEGHQACVNIFLSQLNVYDHYDIIHRRFINLMNLQCEPLIDPADHSKI